MNDLLIKNPAHGIVLPIDVAKIKKRALSESEMLTVKSLDLDDRTRCFVYLLMYSGMRKSEALAITKGDIDIDNNLITVSKSLLFKVNQSEVKGTKTTSSIRTIPISEPLRPILYEYVKKIDTNFLFSSRDGGSISHTGYRRMWGKFEKAMNTKEITAHIFRHNFATILYNAGVDVKSAQYMLGHKSISVTLDIYTHLDKSKKDMAANKLNNFLTNLD